MERREIYAEVDMEIERARSKYPAGDADNRFMGLASEAGEAVQAVTKWRQNPSDDTKEAARVELIQSMGQHVRALEELGLKDSCSVCGDLGMVEDLIFHPDFGPDVVMKPCPACSVTKIHIGWKVLFFIAIVYIALVAMGVL